MLKDRPTVGLIETERILGGRRRFSWVSWVLLPALLAGGSFALGLIISPTRPVWVYPLGIGVLVVVSFLWGMTEYAERVGAKLLEAKYHTIRLDRPEYVDRIKIGTAGCARIMEVEVENRREGKGPFDVALVKLPEGSERGD